MPSKKIDIRNWKVDHMLNVKSDDPIYHIHEYDIDKKSNHIYLMGVDRGYEMTGVEGTDEPGIDYVIAKRFIKNFGIIMRSSRKPIVIHMKTCGGDWTEGMAIYDTIKTCPWPVTILNYTHARSMSSIIFQAANKRIMMPNSYFMIHDGTYGIDGTTKQVRSAVAFDKRVSDKTMMDIYVKAMKESTHGKFANKTVKYIRTWLRNRMDKEEDVYFTAKEAVELGFADAIFDSNYKALSQYTKEQLER
jgi:ATP-dependent protease ClpP protease subunit